MVVDSKTLNEVIEGDLSMLQVLGDHVGRQDLTKSKRFPDSTISSLKGEIVGIWEILRFVELESM